MSDHLSPDQVTKIVTKAIVESQPVPSPSGAGPASPTKTPRPKETRAKAPAATSGFRLLSALGIPLVCLAVSASVAWKVGVMSALIGIQVR